MYQVPSATMMPTLRIGETILVDPSSYAKRAPWIGDIIAFHPPAGADAATLLCGNPHEGLYHRQACGVPMAAASSQTFIKRVVAGPGDRVTLKNGGVIRNGTWRPSRFASHVQPQAFAPSRSPSRSRPTSTSSSVTTAPPRPTAGTGARQAIVDHRAPGARDPLAHFLLAPGARTQAAAERDGSPPG